MAAKVHKFADSGLQSFMDPTHWWVIRDDVEHAMGHPPLTKEDGYWLDLCVAAANALIRRFRCDLPIPVRKGAFTGQHNCDFWTAPGNVDPQTAYGAIQLVIEMYRRRGLTSGENMPQFSEFGPPPSSLSYEAQMFLGLGRHHAPVVA